MNKFLIIIIFFLLTNSLSAEIIKKINITGNERVSDETVCMEKSRLVRM